jgi:hypothetical protein
MKTSLNLKSGSIKSRGNPEETDRVSTLEEQRLFSPPNGGRILDRNSPSVRVDVPQKRWGGFFRVWGGIAVVLSTFFSGSEVSAGSVGRVGIGVSVGNGGNPWRGGRPGFCRPGYPVSRGGGVSVIVPVYGFGGWVDPWYAPPAYGWDPYGTYSYGSYYGSYYPPAYGPLPPGSRAVFSDAQRQRAGVSPSPGPSFTPPPYTPLERSLEKSWEKSGGAPLENSYPRPYGSGSSGRGASNGSSARSKTAASVPSERAALGGVGYPSGPTPTGHPRVYRVQKVLKELSYYEADVDGQLGRATQTAIRTYQIDRGLPVTGRIDATLEKELGLSPEL